MSLTNTQYYNKKLELLRNQLDKTITEIANYERLLLIPTTYITDNRYGGWYVNSSVIIDDKDNIESGLQRTKQTKIQLENKILKYSEILKNGDTNLEKYYTTDVENNYQSYILIIVANNEYEAYMKFESQMQDIERYIHHHR